MGQIFFAVSRVMIIATGLVLLGGLLQVHGQNNDLDVNLDPETQHRSKITISLNNCHLFVQEHVDWYTAKARCRSYGGFLAQPDNYWKNDQLKQQLRWRSPGQDVWFGLNKMGNAWCHIDGSFVNYKDWGPGEPNNLGGIENCGHFTARPYFNFRWNDETCFSRKYFVCQMSYTHGCRYQWKNSFRSFSALRN